MPNQLIISILLLLPYWGFASIQDVDRLHDKCYGLFGVSNDSVLLVADEALEIAENSSYAWGVANSYYIKAYAYDEKGDLSKALLMYLNASNILNDLADERSLKTNLDIALNMGSILRKYHKYDEAVDFLDKALTQADTKAFPKQRMKLLYNKASVLQDKKDLPGALNALKEASQIAEQIEDDRMLVKCWNLLGIVNKDNGDYPRANEYYEKIISFTGADKKATALAYHNIGIVSMHRQNYDSALLVFNNAVEIEREIEHEEFLFMTLHQITKTYVRTGETENALEYAKMSEELYDHVVSIPETYSIFHTLDSLHHVLGHNELSRKYADKYYTSSVAFFENQNEVIKLKDQFQIELLIAGFYQELEVKERNSAFQKVIIILVLVGFICSLFFYLRHWVWKNDLKKVVEPYMRE